MLKALRDLLGLAHLHRNSRVTQAKKASSSNAGLSARLAQPVAVGIAERPQHPPFERNVYKFVREVLDELAPIVSIRAGVDMHEFPDLLTQACQDLYNEFLGLNSGGFVSYATHFRRFAYVYEWMACHARQLQNVLAGSNEANQLFSRPDVTVVCIGGGPGTELLAFADYMTLAGKTTSVRAIVCDGESGWELYRKQIAKRVANYFDIRHEYLEMDVRQEDSWRSHLRELRADLYVVSYCVSELIAAPGGSVSFFEALFEFASPGAVFVFVDVSHTTTYGWIDALPWSKYQVDADEEVSASLVMGEKREAWATKRRWSTSFVPQFNPTFAFRVFRKPIR